ncbi:MAG: hypothetical protein N3D15_03650 [Syntrophorhabdaceae bacterium]|nr:hypothetical protein [Syntrophorhabdaceae bacterium]
MKGKGNVLRMNRLSIVSVIFLLFTLINYANPLFGQDKEPPDTILDVLVPQWQITGSSTTRSDYYFNKGDDTQSPYQRTGAQFYNDININFNKRNSQYDLWRGEVSGVINDSMYRNNFYGVVPERLNLTREKGDIPVPFRLEMGDIFSYYSYRTMQTSLKGAQIDLQPFQDSERKHSIFFTSGAQIASWRDFQPSDSYFNGASYLIDDPVFGKYSLNVVNNMRQGSADETTAWRTQTVYSIAGSNNVSVGNQNLLLEGEFSMFHGDHDGFGDIESGQNKNDKAIFFQGSGKSKSPLTYRLRYEEYGRDYRPVGAAISPGTRNMEAHGGWLFKGGYQLRGRAQKIRDGYQGDNPTDTVIYGLNLTGPLGSIDMFMQDAANKDRTVDTLTNNINLNLNIPKIAGWVARLGYQYQNMYNRVPGSNDNEVNQVTLNATHGLSFWNIDSSITPGFVLRKINNPTSRAWEVNPTLALALKTGKHSLDYNLSWYDQRRLIANNPDITTTTQSLNYRYTEKKYIVGVECSSGYRVPDPGRSIDYYKIGAFFTYYFEKPVTKVPPVKTDLTMVATSIPSPMIVDIAALPPGLKIDQAKEILKKNNIVDPVSQDDLLIYEARVFEEIELRQRLALIQKNNLINKSAIIVDFNITDRPADIMQTYQRVSSILLNKYGTPTNFYERGTVGANLMDDIRNGNFIRISEWSRPGGVIRLGLPRRLDGRVRMEIQFAPSFPPPGETLWSVEEVR